MTDFNLYKDSFKALSRLNESLKNTAAKNRISPQALIVLSALNCGVDLSFIVREEYIKELVNFGFAEKNGDSYAVTGKGAILAKSLERIV